MNTALENGFHIGGKTLSVKQKTLTRNNANNQVLINDFWRIFQRSDWLQSQDMVCASLEHGKVLASRKQQQ